MQNVAETQARDTLRCPPPFDLSKRLHEALDVVLEGHAAASDVAELAALEGAFVALLGAHRRLARRDGAR